ncbi:MAG: DUF4097 domain-containing protein [Phycisphaerales bacterium]
MRVSRSIVSLVVLLLVACFQTGCFLTYEKATETRTYQVDMASATAFEIATTNGLVDLVVDPTLTTAEITAEVKATGATMEEAESRLALITVTIETTAEGVVVLGVDTADERRSGDGCSFTIRTPAADAATIVTRNGAVTVTGVTGPANLETSNGVITVRDHAGAVRAETSNGRISISGKSIGEVFASSSNGAIEVVDAAGPVEARTSNGAIRCSLTDAASGPVKARTSNGSVTLDLPVSIGGSLRADTSNGSVSVENGQSAAGLSASKKAATIQLSDGEGGPESTINTSNGSIVIRLR